MLLIGMKSLKPVLLIVAVGSSIAAFAQGVATGAHPAAGDVHPAAVETHPAATDSHPAKADVHPAAPAEVHPANPGYVATNATGTLGGISAPQAFTTNSINGTSPTPVEKFSTPTFVPTPPSTLAATNSSTTVTTPVDVAPVQSDDSQP